MSNGARVVQRFGVAGARGQAAEGFPHVLEAGLPALHRFACERLQRRRSAGSTHCWRSSRHSTIPACCIAAARSHSRPRKQVPAKYCEQAAQHGREAALLSPASTNALTELNASPGGAADLLAATLFLDTLPHVG